MALTFCIKAINSGGAKEYKQRVPGIFAKIIQSQRCSLSMQTPLAPLIWRQITPLQCQFYEM